jgi:serine/threonine-protein kinase
MPLSAGTRLGPYEILTSLGAGGMGEVYKARDTRLERAVAIKILPEVLAADPQFRERFDREARTISKITHPHICTLYDVGEHDGTAFLVLEFLEGETLADRLKKGALPVDEALKISIQIADALSTAHRGGIVHRDLKPGNIFLCSRGPTSARARSADAPREGRRRYVAENVEVKLLDFGLAKTNMPFVSGAGPSMLATTPPDLTGRGAILGTFQYMAPEQLEGLPADGRADIFAFGAVLYEMVTGRRAFDGKSPASVIGAIMTTTPAPISTIQPLVPAAVDRVITTCLAKDPDDRWQTARDLARELKWVADGSFPEIRSASARVGPSRAGLTRILPWASAGALVGAAAVFTFMAPWRSAPARAPVRLTVDLGADASLPTEVGPNITLSPDGTMLAFVALKDDSNTTQLYVRRLDQMRAVPLSGTVNAREPFFSPDGQSIAFFDRTKLKKVSIAGGAPVTLGDAADPRGGTWTEDGAIIFQPIPQLDKSLMRVSAAGGSVEPFLNAPDIQASIRWPQLLPGGKAVLYTAGVAAQFENAAIVVQPLRAAAPKIIHRGGYFARYASTGHIMYLHDGTLFAVPFNVERLDVTGQAVPIIEGVSGSAGTGGAEVAVSHTGTLMYVPGQPVQDVIHWMGRTGETTVLRAAAGIWTNPSFSPDGQRLAMDISDGKQIDVWVYEWGRDTATRLTVDPANAVRPVWTPDGRRLAFASSRAGGRRNLFWQRVDGTGDSQRLTESPNDQTPGSWHPSGKFLAYTESRPNTNLDLMVLPMSGDESSGWKPGTPTVFLGTPFDESSPMFSPDGHWIAYESNETGRSEVFVRPFPGPGAKSQISINGGSAPRWSLAKRELLYRGADNHIMMVAYTILGESFRSEKPQLWSDRALPANLIRPTQREVFALHPDGERIALAVPPDAAPGTLDRVVVIFNFFDELRRLAPPGTR